MRANINSCITHSDKRKVFSVSEEGKTYQLNNSSKIKISCVDVDKCVFKSSADKRCDYMFETHVNDKKTREKAFFVELKGADILDGVKQILKTVEAFGSCLTNHTLEARIVTSNGVPSAIRNGREYKNLSKHIVTSGGKIIIKNQKVFTETI